MEHVKQLKIQMNQASLNEMMLHQKRQLETQKLLNRKFQEQQTQLYNK